jgi:hypothetical protein
MFVVPKVPLRVSPADFFYQLWNSLDLRTNTTYTTPPATSNPTLTPFEILTRKRLFLKFDVLIVFGSP